MSSELQFFISAREGDLQFLEEFVADGGDVNILNAGGANALQMASKSGQTTVVKFLLECGATVDPPTAPCFSSSLIRASTYDHPEIVALLLESGANPNIVDEAGQTALIWACSRPQGVSPSIVSELIAHGADPHVRDNRGNNAIEYATAFGLTQFLPLLETSAQS